MVAGLLILAIFLLVFWLFFLQAETSQIKSRLGSCIRAGIRPRAADLPDRHAVRDTLLD
jgi:hypothetical protein